MPRRRPFGARPSFTRTARLSVLIVIGAEKTETAYLRALGRRFDLGAVTIVEKPGAPDRLVTYARDVYGAEGYSQIWCVTDVDHYEREGGKVTAACAIAAQSGIEMAVSNPCFELWLLLHHAACSGYCANCEAVAKKLKRSLPAYDKRRLRFEDFEAGLDDAITRGKVLEPTGTDHAINPSTGVWRLVGALLEKE
ncbi:RloB family protein [Actinoplanes sp. CA-054009]